MVEDGDFPCSFWLDIYGPVISYNHCSVLGGGEIGNNPLVALIFLPEAEMRSRCQPPTSMVILNFSSLFEPTSNQTTQDAFDQSIVDPVANKFSA
jgi:hypothetical protein